MSIYEMICETLEEDVLRPSEAQEAYDKTRDETLKNLVLNLESSVKALYEHCRRKAMNYEGPN